MKGIIKRINDGGFGFITADGSKDVFFHQTATNGEFDNMKEGMTVQFDTEESEKGPRAVNVVAVAADEDLNMAA